MLLAQRALDEALSRWLTWKHRGLPPVDVLIGLPEPGLASCRDREEAPVSPDCHISKTVAPASRFSTQWECGRSVGDEAAGRALHAGPESPSASRAAWTPI